MNQKIQTVSIDGSVTLVPLHVNEVILTPQEIKNQIQYIQGSIQSLTKQLNDAQSHLALLQEAQERSDNAVKINNIKP